MNINGSEKWIGSEPHPVSVKQEIYFAIIEEMTGETFNARNSEEAYDIIGEYKSRIENDVSVEYFFDCDDSHVFYSDIYIFDRYRFTIRSTCGEPLDYDEPINMDDVVSYEIYKDDSFV